MDRLADIVVYALSYIDARSDTTETELDNDVHAEERIAHILEHATEDEKDALAAAAKRALAHELDLFAPDPRLIHSYGVWMEEVFGKGWHGNDRVADTHHHE